MIQAERLRTLMTEKGLSQAELARRCGMTQSAIAHLLGGRSAGSKHLWKIARELGTTEAYLTGETDDRSAGAIPLPSTDNMLDALDLVPIVSIDLAYGLGETYTDVPIEQDVMHFPAAWVASITATPPALLTFARGKGDSMSPTIQDNDMILIDRSQRIVREQDALWALAIGDVGMVKRLRIRGGKVTILSDNDRVPSDEALPEEVFIVGRVVFIGRRT